MNPQKLIKLLEQTIGQSFIIIIGIMIIIVIAYILYRLHWVTSPKCIANRYWRNTDLSPFFVLFLLLGFSPKEKKRDGLKIQCERYMYKLNEKYTNYISSMPFSDVITTTDPVISYEKPIPTNPTQETQHIKQVPPNLFSFVEPNKTPPGHYNDSKLDLLVTNGLFTIGTN